MSDFSEIKSSLDAQVINVERYRKKKFTLYIFLFIFYLFLLSLPAIASYYFPKWMIGFLITYVVILPIFYYFLKAKRKRLNYQAFAAEQLLKPLVKKTRSTLKIKTGTQLTNESSMPEIWESKLFPILENMGDYTYVEQRNRISEAVSSSHLEFSQIDISKEEYSRGNSWAGKHLSRSMFFCIENKGWNFEDFYLLPRKGGLFGNTTSHAYMKKIERADHAKFANRFDFYGSPNTLDTFIKSTVNPIKEISDRWNSEIRLRAHNENIHINITLNDASFLQPKLFKNLNRSNELERIYKNLLTCLELVSVVNEIKYVDKKS
ncbi:MAG: hypothetical protein ACI837_003180 [Crocinitomicaceae bacterium]|jgi:hypothetical protein